MNTQYSLVVEAGPDRGKSYPLFESPVVLGRQRAESGRIQINAADISRQHARLTIDDAQLMIEDLGSVNGTFVNGVRLGADAVVLHAGDRIQLGATVRFNVHETPASVSAPIETTAATIFSDELSSQQPKTTPRLTVAITGGETTAYELGNTTLGLGRAEDNDIVIPAPTVSRQHARIEATEGGHRITVLPEASNPLLFEGRAIEAPHLLQHGDVLRIGSDAPGLMVTLTYDEGGQARVEEDSLAIRFGERSTLVLGRDPSCDVVLDAPNVSRYHAQIERIGQRYRIQDLRSSNGTFVNDQRQEGQIWLNTSDTIRIGPYRFLMGEDALAQFDESRGLQAEAFNLQKWVRTDLNILQDISVVFKPREFIVIVGQSGGGKTTLMDAVAGYRPATHGRVLVNDIDVYQNFDAIRNRIGYVPQRDIIHMELTVYDALDYAAKLRMPADTTEAERDQRVKEVLEDLDLAHRADVQISGLSGGQQKRVSIGVELLTKPGLFFLDEATSGLDPGTETSLMQLLRRLADQGRTIVLVTHATKNVMLADKVLFMARGGYLAWFGPPDEALEYFDGYRSDRERRTGSMEFDQIYAILDDPRHGSPQEWAARFKAHPAYQRYIEAALEPKRASLAGAPGPVYSQAASAPLQPRSQVSSWRQFQILSSRNLKILTRDRVSLLLMLGAPPLVSLLDLLLALMMGRDQFSFTEGNVANIGMTFFLLSIFAMFVGGLSQMREIVKENDIYKRERLVNLNIMPYVFSKVWVAVLLSLYHGAAYVLMHYLAYKMSGGIVEFLLMYITMTLATIAGMMLGLFASAVAPNANTAPMLIILLIMPQVVLSGALVPLPSALSAPTATRWTFESMMAISGLGSDVAADPCWDLPEELRSIMTIDDKTAHCNCMGLNVLREDQCNFPGLGQFYDAVVDEPKPQEPPPLREKPPDPVIPAEPEKPEDESDSVAMADYFEAIEAYQEQVSVIQDQFQSEMRAYEAEADVYQVEMQDYQERYLEWELTRAGAVEAAEGLVGSFHGDYGWTFVDKQNLAAYLGKTLRSWFALTAIVAVLLLGVLWMVKRKDEI